MVAVDADDPAADSLALALPSLTNAAAALDADSSLSVTSVTLKSLIKSGSVLVTLSKHGTQLPI